MTNCCCKILAVFQRLFLFLARLVKDKNPDYLIKAFVKSRHKDKKLVIAGNNNADMGYVNYLHQLADGCTDVVFTGAVYGEEKEALLRNAYTFVFRQP